MKEGIDGIWKAAERCGQSDPVMPRPFSTRPFKRSWTITNVVRPLSRLGTGPATEGQRHGLTPTKSNNTPLTDPFGGEHRGQGQRPRWPLISRHVWTRPHTMHGLKLVIRICGDKGGQEGSKLLQASCLHLCVCCWHGDLVSGPQTTGPSLKPPPYLPLMCSSCLRSLCCRARREELHQGWSRITGPACLSGWA